jgi:hypothetical protein
MGEKEAASQPGVDGLAGDALHALEEGLIDGRAAELVDQFVVIDSARAALHLPRRALLRVLHRLVLRLWHGCHVRRVSALHFLLLFACVVIRQNKIIAVYLLFLSRIPKRKTHKMSEEITRNEKCIRNTKENTKETIFNINLFLSCAKLTR